MSRKLTTEEFIEKAKIVHGDKYKYSNTIYLHSKSKVLITCCIEGHEDFATLPSDLIRGQGCPKCANSKKGKYLQYSQEDFILKANKKHGSKYDYSLTEYLDSKTKITIICPTHGKWSVEPSSHLAGCGCPTCGREKSDASRTKPVSSFLEKAESVHGDRYDYSQVQYVNTKTHVDIRCKQHGIFSCTPYNHCSGRGCPDCSVHGYKRNTQGTFYVISSKDYVKVGITNGKVVERVKAINRSSGLDFNIVHFMTFTDGRVADDIETIVLKVLRSKYKSPLEKFDGSTECFITQDTQSILKVVFEAANSLTYCEGDHNNNISI